MNELNSSNVEHLVKDLDSQQIEKQVLAIEKIAEVIDFLVVTVVETLENCNDPFVIAERLYRFGTLAIPPLEKLLKKSKKSEVSIFAALALMGLGSKVGIPKLLNYITKNEKYAYLISRHLAIEGIKEATEPILNLLRNCEINRVEEIITLIEALNKLNTTIPLDIYERLNNPDTPWRIRFFLWRIENDRQGYCNLDEASEFWQFLETSSDEY